MVVSELLELLLSTSDRGLQCERDTMQLRLLAPTGLVIDGDKKLWGEEGGGRGPGSATSTNGGSDRNGVVAVRGVDRPDGRVDGDRQWCSTDR